MKSYDQLVQETVNEHKANPIDLLGIGDANGELNYLNAHIKVYSRTIRDIDQLFNSDRPRRILEIGSFLGVVSISLKRLGHAVYALDIPEFQQSEKLRGLYEKHEIPFAAANLKHALLPYEDDYFDAVILCDVLEHLNFNPLPILQEINRVTKASGYLYIGMPNQANIGHRLNLLRGKSIHPPIAAFFSQLSKEDNMVVGIHWREYTLQETVEMISKMGFQPVKTYYESFFNPEAQWGKSLLKKMLFTVPSFRPLQVVIGQKQSKPHYDFWVTEANS